MSTNTSGGTTTSFTKTPQAQDDSYFYDEEQLLNDPSIYDQATRTISLDVLSNDLGGKAKSLYSIDDGGSGAMTDLLQSNTTTGWERTAQGNWIRINGGKIEYRLDDGSNSAGLPRDVNSLGANETIADSFVYAIRLANGTLSYATVSLSLTGSNDGPTANADTASTGEDSSVTINVLANDTDPDRSDVLTVSSADLASGLGSVSVVANQIVYNPGSAYNYLAAGESATVIINYWIDDGNGGTSSSTVTVTVNGSNDGPVISAGFGDSDSASRHETNAELTASGTLTITDVDTSDEVDVNVASVAVGGTGGAGGLSEAQLLAMLSLTGNDDNAADGTAGSLGWSFDSDGEAFDFLAAEETLVLTYTLSATDGNGGSDTHTITLTITGTNDAPVVTNAIVDQHVDEDVVWNFTVPANAFGDVDGDALSYSATLGSGDPLPSWLTFDAETRTFSGTPPQDFNGTISLSVTASDGSLSVSETFDLIVDPVNDAPDAAPVVLGAIAEDSGPRIITQAELLAGASDIDGDSLTVTALSIATGSGTLIANADGTWTYTPAANDDTSVTFNYTVSDGALTDSSAATMDITPADDFAYTAPAAYTGTGDPNDFDSFGNPAGQNLSSTATSGNDTIYGGAGADTINGGGGDDTIYGGSGNDNLGGGGDGDTLYGGSGSDTISGGNNNDRIIGGYGADTLTGNNGADTFVYLSQRDTGDRITDFTEAEGDKIEFGSAFGFDSTDFVGALSSAGAVDAGKFGYMYDSATNTTTIYVDTDGAFGADMEIKLTGNVSLTSGDFVFGT